MSISQGTILRVVASLVFPDNVIMQNVFHLVLTTAGTSDDEDDVVSDMVDYLEAIWAEIVNEVSADVDADEVKVYEYDPIDDDWDEIGTSSFTDAFVGNTDLLPHGCAQVVNLFTTDPDVQGRKYFGGLTEAFQDTSVWTAGHLAHFVSAIGEVVAQYVGAATAATFTPGVWSPTNTNFYAYNGTVNINTLVGYQRRRKPGVGI